MNRVRTSPRAKLVEDLRFHTRERFNGKLKEAFRTTFAIEVDTHWNIFSDNLVTNRVDNLPLTEQQVAFIAGFEFAWLAVLEIAEHIK